MKKIVIMPGGFHPFHAGHMALYNAAREAFPSADVFVAATDDVSNRPFPFKTKKFLAQQAGVPGNRFIRVKSPFRAEEITQMYDPNTTQLIFVRSEKDAAKPPQAGGVKKNGEPSYLQPYKRNGLQPFGQHAYMAYLPTVQFGPGMSSATEIRAKWPEMSPEEKISLVKVLYPTTADRDAAAGKIVAILDQVLGESLEEIAPALAAMGGRLAGGALASELGLSAASSELATNLGGSLAYDWAAGQNDSEVDEAVLVNDPDAGHLIRPDGGMGTWDEKSMVTNLAGKFADMANMIKNKNYTGIQYVLYQGGVVKNMVNALVQYQKFMERQGRRPIARGREIDLAQDYLDEGDVIPFPAERQPPANYEAARALGMKIVQLIKDESIADPTPLLSPMRTELKRLGYRVRFSNRGAELVHDQSAWSTVLDDLSDVKEARIPHASQ